MRVIAGKARRLKIEVPPGDGVRPTTDRIKETLFNIIQADVYGSNFLDLFAGSGGIGIEALSRGAKSAVFVDNGRDAVRCIERNLEHTRLGAGAEILPMDAVGAIRSLSRRGRFFDIVFMDPPYGKDLEFGALKALGGSGIISGESLVIAETLAGVSEERFNDCNFDVVRVKRYKTNQHVFLKYRNDQ